MLHASSAPHDATRVEHVCARVELRGDVDVPLWPLVPTPARYPGMADQFAWRRQVTEDFEALAPGCPALVRKGFKELPTSSANLSKQVKVCGGAHFHWQDFQSIAWGTGFCGAMRCSVCVCVCVCVVVGGGGGGEGTLHSHLHSHSHLHLHLHLHLRRAQVSQKVHTFLDKSLQA